MFESTTSYQGSLYYESVWSQQSFRGREDTMMEIYTLDPETMALRSVANSTTSEFEARAIRNSRGSACYFWSQAIACVLAASVVFPASFWLLKSKQIPAGVAPACLASLYALFLIGSDFAYGIGVLAVIATTAGLLGSPPSWMERETLVWIHYSIITFFVVVEGMIEENPTMVILGMVCGLVLDHPILQISGWIVGIGAIFAGFFIFFLNGNSEAYEAFFIIPIGIVGGCGLVSAGQCLTKYRAFLRFYLRRLWRAVDSVRAGDTVGAGHQRSTGDDNELRRGLLDRRS